MHVYACRLSFIRATFLLFHNLLAPAAAVTIIINLIINIIVSSSLLLQQYVPLFLTKEDLDVAVSGAYRQRNAAQITAVKDKVCVCEREDGSVGGGCRGGESCQTSHVECVTLQRTAPRLLGC